MLSVKDDHGCMTDIINLRTARKAKARADAEATANANRAAFGRTKAAKSAVATEAARTDRALDGAKRGKSPSERPGGC